MASSVGKEENQLNELDTDIAEKNDLAHDGQPLVEVHCEKNPGHDGFIEVNNLKLEDLPEKYRDVKTLEKIKTLSKRVVKLVVKKSRNRTETGSGFCLKYGSDYLILTNNHVVKSQEEVENCEIQFFYDSDKDKCDIVYCQGLKLRITFGCGDITMFSFSPTPAITELNIPDMEMLYPVLTVIYNNGMVIQDLPSAPELKPDSFPPYFTNVELNDPNIFITFITFGDGFMSWLASSFFTFQLLASPIPELTLVEVHIDEGRDSPRIIQGHIVRLDDIYVVRTTAIVQQNDVQNCKLVWNREVVGTGQKLYFLNIYNNKKPMDIKENKLDLYPGRIWFLDFKPRPAELNYTQKKMRISFIGADLCTIGHPHGSAKSVTFGKGIGFSSEMMKEGRDDEYYKSLCEESYLNMKGPIHMRGNVKTNNTSPVASSDTGKSESDQGPEKRKSESGGSLETRKSEPKTEKVPVLKHSCLVCKGSSGSPVFWFGNLSGFEFAIHFQGKKIDFTHRGKQIKNMNKALICV